MKKFLYFLIALTLGVTPAFTQQSWDKQVKMGNDFVLKDRDSIVSSNMLATTGMDISGAPSNSIVTGLWGGSLPEPTTNDVGKAYSWNGSAWLLVSGGGVTSSWGQIGGTLSAQSDLWTQLTNRYTKSEVDTAFLKKTGGVISGPITATGFYGESVSIFPGIFGLKGGLVEAYNALGNFATLAPTTSAGLFAGSGVGSTEQVLLGSTNYAIEVTDGHTKLLDTEVDGYAVFSSSNSFIGQVYMGNGTTRSGITFQNGGGTPSILEFDPSNGYMYLGDSTNNLGVLECNFGEIYLGSSDFAADVQLNFYTEGGGGFIVCPNADGILEVTTDAVAGDDIVNYQTMTGAIATAISNYEPPITNRTTVAFTNNTMTFGDGFQMSFIEGDGFITLDDAKLYTTRSSGNWFLRSYGIAGAQPEIFNSIYGPMGEEALSVSYKASRTPTTIGTLKKLGGQPWYSPGTPTVANHIANKSYVDSVNYWTRSSTNVTLKTVNDNVTISSSALGNGMLVLDTSAQQDGEQLVFKSSWSSSPVWINGMSWKDANDALQMSMYLYKTATNDGNFHIYNDIDNELMLQIKLLNKRADFYGDVYASNQKLATVDYVDTNYAKLNGDNVFTGSMTLTNPASPVSVSIDLDNGISLTDAGSGMDVDIFSDNSGIIRALFSSADIIIGGRGDFSDYALYASNSVSGSSRSAYFKGAPMEADSIILGGNMILSSGSYFTTGGFGDALSSSDDSYYISIGDGGIDVFQNTGTVFIVRDGAAPLLEDSSGIWRSEGFASNSTEIVNYQTMTNNIQTAFTSFMNDGSTFYSEWSGPTNSLYIVSPNGQYTNLLMTTAP